METPNKGRLNYLRNGSNKGLSGENSVQNGFWGLIVPEVIYKDDFEAYSLTLSCLESPLFATFRFWDK